jgi:hypothetical protein
VTTLSNELDPSLSARKVADFESRSIVSINRDVRNGRYPQPDYTIGQYRFWKLSTLIRARERRIGESAAKAAAQRQAQIDAAERARAGQREKRALRAAASSTDAA